MSDPEDVHLPQREGDGIFNFVRTHWAYGLFVWPVLLYGNVVQGDLLMRCRHLTSRGARVSMFRCADVCVHARARGRV